ncbi:hypothetical protein IQ22_02694 [Pseudomonas duriflava]|uniref:Retropepsin-like aspartic endopeptidase domain-containing protein n=1 Tax=Pseudomonas duriflava TaxID=459528 RepID=A0A562Q9P8_9PSED|nr:ATP-dependent zinc protease [Pseudomonas duriflava]TWI53477.1 hypothetical protein IQ22_02694 [Pseudomonas duriflava]
MKFIPYLVSSLLLPWPSLSVSAEKSVYGLHEYVQLPELNIRVKAKLDTGAETASLSAHHIEPFTRDGEPWVRFTMAHDTIHAPSIERPLVRMSYIKRRQGDHMSGVELRHTPRPVVTLVACLGSQLRTIEVNLTDRSHFDYPLLIGSKALKHYGALVDVSRAYSAGTPACPT